MSIMLKNTAASQKQYATWSAFKKDLELNLWCHLENGLWLKIKPKRALPWNDSDMRTALSKVLSL